jgi:dTMP kinase
MRNLDIFRNKLICFEGGDSTGKTSTSKELALYLNEKKIPTVWTFQPGDNMYGTHAAFIRSLCKDSRWELSAEANLFAFLLDRAEVTNKVILPALQEGKTVISDRLQYSTVAYQLYGKQLIDKCWGETLETLLEQLGPEPDMTFYFPEHLKMGNDRENNTYDQFEHNGHSFMDRVHEAYSVMSAKYNWIKILPGDTPKATMWHCIEEVAPLPLKANEK